MHFRANEWSHRMCGLLARWVGDLSRAQAQTNSALAAIQGQLEQLTAVAPIPAPARDQAQAEENREYRIRFWNAGAEGAQSGQPLPSTQERLYFALAERDRLEAETRQGQIREGTLLARLSALEEEASVLRAEKETSRQEVETMRRAAQTTQATVKRAAEELWRLRTETAELRKTVAQVAALALEGPAAALEQENARLERELWLLESEGKLERETLREELHQARTCAKELEEKVRERHAAAECAEQRALELERALDKEIREGRAEFEEQLRQSEETCIRLTSENTTLSVVLKEKEDTLARTEERLARVTATQDSFEQELHQYEARDGEAAQAEDRIGHLETLLAMAERQIADLREQLWPPAQGENVAPESGSRIMPWPKSHGWIHPPETEPFGVRLGEAGELEALAG